MESNVQKMREAARHLLCVIDEMGLKPWCADDPLAIACDKLDAALALPLSNADVGTAAEQAKRMDVYCSLNGKDEMGCYRCEKCNLFRIDRCELAWAQMPYEEGEEK